VEIRLLGPVEVVDDEGRPVEIGGAMQRALLAALAAHGPTALSTTRLVDELWGDDPPPTAVKTLQAYVSRLRSSLGGDAIRSSAGGYAVGGGVSVDAAEFERLVAEAREARPQRAAELLRDALALWRGDPLAGIAAPFAAREARRLEELRLAALEDRVEAELALGRDAALVPELTALVAAHPLRERLRGQLMLALYRSRRQAEALESYQQTRRHLVDQLGIEPSDTLRELERRILRHDPTLLRDETVPRMTASRRRAAPVVVVTAAIVALAAAWAWHAHRSAAGGTAANRRVALVVREVRGASASAHVALPVDGLNRAERRLGVRTRVVDAGAAAPGYAAALARAARWAGLVIGAEPLEAREAADVARRFPRVRFALLGTTVSELSDPPPNVTGITFDNREVGYLAGYLAALEARAARSRGHVVSAVGGTPTAAVRAILAGYGAGARAARPATRVLLAYAHTFVNQSRCEDLANQQIDAGSTVVFDVAGACGGGALEAADVRGVWGIGVDTDMSYLGPHILASAVIRTDAATLLVVRSFVDGALPRDHDIRLDLAQDGVGLVGLSERVGADVRRNVAEAAATLRTRDGG
jgi:basic membrane lipoprotein Med (substrate-binding protein (PBP1-ABC) superfamily)/DNA-binding SARP family transcriptional activator